MRGTRPITGAAGLLRARLERLDGLPLRPSSIRSVFLGTPESPPSPSPRDDPGWALAVATRDEDRARDLLVDLPWWPPCDGPAAEARDRLWRFSVATATAARSLAAEAGDPDPEAVARAALLHPIALWALAAVDPPRLAEWMLADNEPDRRRREFAWFGRDAASFGFHLARRWGGEPVLLDATLLAGVLGPVAPGVAAEPARLDLIRCGRSWAMTTPWALPGLSPPEGPPKDRRRWLIASVQSRCAGSLAGADERPDAREALRDLARRDLRDERHDSEMVDLASRLQAAIEGLDRGDPDNDARHAAAVLDAMAEFAAGAAHELNNPLAVIAGRAQLLQTRLDDPEHRKALQTIIGQARRAHQILRDLIYIARPPAPRRVPCVPDQVLKAVVDDLEAEARSRRIRLTCRSSRPTTPSVTDPEALRHLADALIRNALEATPEGGDVVAESIDDPRSLVWVVRDSGIGLDPERATHLLDPFYCGRQAGRGLGLGLPRVARFVRLSGGEFRWYPAPGGGSVVRVELPLDPGGERTSPEPRRAELRDVG